MNCRTRPKGKFDKPNFANPRFAILTKSDIVLVKSTEFTTQKNNCGGRDSNPRRFTSQDLKSCPLGQLGYPRMRDFYL